jgi:hypothetical protein
MIALFLSENPMSIAERYQNPVNVSEGKQFECREYTPISASDRHCRHYIAGGNCALSDNRRCVEWIKRNSGRQQNTPPAQTDLFGYPISDSKPKGRKPSTPLSEKTIAPPPEPPWSTVKTKPLSGFSPELIESFKQMQTEICFTSEAGQFWLVPAYRDRSRGEITPEHLALICNILMAFPGATVVAFENIPPKKENSDE